MRRVEETSIKRYELNGVVLGISGGVDVLLVFPELLRLVGDHVAAADVKNVPYAGM